MQLPSRFNVYFTQTVLIHLLVMIYRDFTNVARTKYRYG
jgi:hypothetical protein